MSEAERAKRLSKVAEELAKAACDQTAEVSIDIQREIAANIVDLKTDTNNGFNTLNNRFDTLNNRFNTLNQNLQDNKKAIESLVAAINTLNTSIKEEGKKTRLTNALQSVRVADHRLFINRNYLGGDQHYRSFLSGILSSFVSGKGCEIHQFISKKTTDRKEFCEQLKIDIKTLTGSVPRFSTDSDGRLCIFYE